MKLPRHGSAENVKPGGVGVFVTDGSASRRAVEWAIHRAVRTRAPLLLISVVGSDSGAAGERGVVERALAGAEVLLDQITRRASAQGLTAEASVDRGDPLARLVAASERAGLLVVGSDRFTGSRRRRGPLAMRVSGEAHCPVVVVPDRDVEGNSGVVVGVDGSEISERRAPPLPARIDDAAAPRGASDRRRRRALTADDGIAHRRTASCLRLASACSPNPRGGPPSALSA